MEGGGGTGARAHAGGRSLGATVQGRKLPTSRLQGFLRPMTAATLRSLTAKDLAQMARERGVAGWHSMRKEELIGALVRIAKRRASADAKGGVNGRQNGHVETPMRRDVQAQRKLSQLQDKL